MFTNHVTSDKSGNEYTGAIWMYWTQDLQHWNPDHLAVAFDGSMSRWSHKVIGLPSVIEKDGKLAVFYDGVADDSAPRPGESGVLWHMRRDVGVAWIQLPIKVPGD
jgi:predicted GH43/DUF377 family glycosyl hydrolase